MLAQGLTPCKSFQDWKREANCSFCFISVCFRNNAAAVHRSIAVGRSTEIKIALYSDGFPHRFQISYKRQVWPFMQSSFSARVPSRKGSVCKSASGVTYAVNYLSRKWGSAVLIDRSFKMPALWPHQPTAEAAVIVHFGAMCLGAGICNQKTIWILLSAFLAGFSSCPGHSSSDCSQSCCS